MSVDLDEAEYANLRQISTDLACETRTLRVTHVAVFRALLAEAAGDLQLQSRIAHRITSKGTD